MTKMIKKEGASQTQKELFTYEVQKEDYFKNSLKNHRKTIVAEPYFSEVAGLKLVTLIQKNSGTVIFSGIFNSGFY